MSRSEEVASKIVIGPDMKLKDRPDHIRLWMEARTLREDANNSDLNMEDQNAKLCEAYERLEGAWTAAMQNGSNWYRQALLDHFRMIGKNKGVQSKTLERMNFIGSIVANEQKRNDLTIEGVVSLALDRKHLSEAKRLWPKKGKEQLERAIREFIAKRGKGAFFGD